MVLGCAARLTCGLSSDVNSMAATKGALANDENELRCMGKLLESR
jgi:hypothetical protein